MIPALRDEFNRRYLPQTYRHFLHSLDACVRTHVEFRVSETPCFFPRELLQSMAATGAELTHRLVSDRAYLEASTAAIPEAYRVANETSHPHFMTADFGLVREPDGSITPRLVEMQAFPSVFGFQFVVSELYRAAYNLDPSLSYFLNGHTEVSFWKLMERIIVAGHDPETVVLADVEPATQKTLPDFHVTADRLGISIVDIAELEPDGQKLYYRKDGRRIAVKRIYNRAIVDELVRKQVPLKFGYGEPLEVEWAGHPNWYFHISKFSLPYLQHWAVPRAVFLNRFLAGKESRALAGSREDWILKPLFSFAGAGIRFAPTDEELHAIPVKQRRNYLLQERVRFEPVIDTPHGKTQAEIRILYLWPDQGHMEPVLSLVRMGRGQMMGVDHNRNQEWVGASAAFFPY